MLFVFVEGIDDEQFFRSVYKQERYNWRFVKYSKMSKKQICSFIKSVRMMSDTDYMFIVDADGCSIEQKKEKTIKKYPVLSIDKVYVVQYEIESWYYAGVSESDCKLLKFKRFVRCTDNFTKEDFNNILYKRSERKLVLEKVLLLFDLSFAIQRNRSLMLFNTDVTRLYLY